MAELGIDYGLEGKVALVTGGARNIGKAAAVQLARCGAKVAIMAKSDSPELAASIAECADLSECWGRPVDIASPEALDGALEQAEAQLGPIDILVNNAAIRPKVKIADIDVAEWSRVVDVNLRAPFLLARRVVDRMAERRWGRIINVSGIDALNGSIDRVHVTTTKGGLLGLTAALAPAVAKYGVTVNTVVPGAVDTVRHTPEWYPEQSAFRAGNINRFPMARFGSSDEVANVITFLSSTLASYLTGQTLVVAGGFPLARRKELEEEQDLDWAGAPIE